MRKGSKKIRRITGYGLVMILGISMCEYANPVLSQAEQAEADYFTGVFQASVAKIAQGDNIFYEYPVLTGIDGYDLSVVDTINQYFYGKASQTVLQQAKEMDAMIEEVKEYYPEAVEYMAYEVSCDQIYIDGEIFSVMQNYYSYTGGAHGYSFPFGTSFNLQTGEKITMGELLGCEETMAHEAVVEAYREYIIGQVENITEESIRSSFDIMEYWMQSDGMYVNIAPYGVASYAAGSQQAVVTPEVFARTLEKIQNGEIVVSSSNGEMLTVINGIQAPTSDFVIPYSSTVALTDADLTVLEGASVEEEHYKSQLAINEILARYGYQFHAEQDGAAKEAYDQFEGKQWYEQAKQYCPSTSANEMLYTYISSLELDNIELICEWQQEHNCYY